jgi:hypothetical protein
MQGRKGEERRCLDFTLGLSEGRGVRAVGGFGGALGAGGV